MPKWPEAHRSRDNRFLGRTKEKERKRKRKRERSLRTRACVLVVAQIGRGECLSYSFTARPRLGRVPTLRTHHYHHRNPTVFPSCPSLRSRVFWLTGWRRGERGDGYSTLRPSGTPRIQGEGGSFPSLILIVFFFFIGHLPSNA
jgi:hypothetical protein